MTEETIHCAWCGDDRGWPQWWSAGGPDGPQRCPRCGLDASGMTLEEWHWARGLERWRASRSRLGLAAYIERTTARWFPWHVAEEDESPSGALVGFIAAALSGAVVAALLVLALR